jgi:predicted GNAT family acetyltransferase
MQAQLLPPISGELISRVLRADTAYTISRMEAIRGQPGHSIEVEVRKRGDIVGLMARGLPSPNFNRVVGLSRGDEKEIAPLHAWYAERQVKTRFELLPDRYDVELGRELSRLGYFQSDFHTSVYTLAFEGGGGADHVDIRPVQDAATLETFLDMYARGWGMPKEVHEGAKANMRNWVDRPSWSLYLGLLEGRPAGAAILYVDAGVAYLADTTTAPECRGRGVQIALLEHLSSAAVAAGAEIICSQATFCSTSFRNLQRIGMQVLHNHGIWTLASA